MARVRFNTTVHLQEGNTNIQELRLGIWSACFYNSSDAPTCLKTRHGYTVHLSRTVGNRTSTATIRSTVTTALIIHPVAAAVTLVVFLCGLTTHRKIMLALGYIALLLSWAAFWIDMSLLIHLRFQVGGFPFGGTVAGGTGMWMTLSTSLLLLFSECKSRPRTSVVNTVPLRIIRMDPPTPGVPAV